MKESELAQLERETQTGFRLKPCPWCGGTSYGHSFRAIPYTRSKEYKAKIRCGNTRCGAAPGYTNGSLEGVVEKWNTRRG